MNLFAQGLSYISKEKLKSAAGIMLLAFGAALWFVAINNHKAEIHFKHDLAAIDLVIGAKGDAERLALSAVLHIGGIPLKNISLKKAEDIIKANADAVYEYFPIALGDSYKNFRIVGTSRKYMTRYASQDIEKGFWPSELEDAVIGYEVARKTGLKRGDKFISGHGLIAGGKLHNEFPYRVTGIMDQQRNIIDRLIFTDSESVGAVHKNKDEITAILLRYKKPQPESNLAQAVNEEKNLMAVSPLQAAGAFLHRLHKTSVIMQLAGITVIFFSATVILMGLIMAKDMEISGVDYIKLLAATVTIYLTAGLAAGFTIARILLKFCLNGWIII